MTDQTPQPTDQPETTPLTRSALPRIEFGKSKSGDRIYYSAVILASIASWVAALLPHFVLVRIVGLIGWISGKRQSTYRTNIRSNLAHVTDQPAESHLVSDLVMSAFKTNALNVADLLEIPHLGRTDFEKRIRVIEGDFSPLDNALAAGKGAIVVTAHLGPFDFVASYLRVRGYPLSALTARTTGRFAFHFVTFLRSSQNMGVIETSSGGLRQALRLLQRGEMLILLSDRDFFLSGRETDFFGERTSLPIGAVRLARDTGVPIIPFFAYREKKHYGLALGDAISIPHTDDRDADLDAGVQLVARELERAIGRAPGQWVLFQQVWPDEPTVSENV
ncbi:MAG: hypothetical protein IT335_05485 [Thermomicrobiales bacterium]|jgi:KDO2-lipid IV(A) lauroyltransferase|nr:hypothetical protein [Thermomicrobiales bacterium]